MQFMLPHRSNASSMKTSIRPLLSHLIGPNTTLCHPFQRVCHPLRCEHHSVCAHPLVSAAVASAQASAGPGSRETPQIPRVVLKGGKSKLFTDQQSPIVYGGAVDRVVGRPTPSSGDTVLVCAGDEKPIGWGVYNPTSMYRVRIMQTAEEVPHEALQTPSMSDLLDVRIAQAISLRQTLGLPSASTTVYRLINSEGDRLSGLIADVLGSQIVVSSSASWVERHRHEIEATLLKHVSGVATLVWRRAAELSIEEGWGDEEKCEGSSAGETELPGSNEYHTVLEGGALFAVDPNGQKTGFYADQRDHRAFIASIAAGRDVLDVCCYTGGFSVRAALGGAKSAMGIDSSGAAVALANRNAELNNVHTRCSFQKADASEFMRNAGKEGRLWDVVVLDPPKLAPSKKALAGALRKYAALNAAAMRLVRPGGLLMTCSCSGAVAQSGEFVPVLQRAAVRAGRRVTVVRVGAAGADHCLDIGYPEGQYLTNICLRVA